MADSDPFVPDPSRRPGKPVRSRLSRRMRLVPWLAGAIGVLANAGLLLNNIPLNRVFELAICRSYYAEHDPSVIGPRGDVPEEMCKEKPIQQKLAFLSRPPRALGWCLW